MAEMGQAKAAEEWAVARTLFREYADALGVDLCFQGFEEELSGLERMYAPPEGRLFLVHDRGELAGCGALRRIGEGVAELKRMYLRPRFRGRGLGRALAEALLGGAREAGYR